MTGNIVISSLCLAAVLTVAVVLAVRVYRVNRAGQIPAAAACCCCCRRPSLWLSRWLWAASHCRRCPHTHTHLRAGRVWAARRKRTVALFAAELLVQLLNLSMFLAPNAFIAARPCSWFTLVRGGAAAACLQALPGSAACSPPCGQPPQRRLWAPADHNQACCLLALHCSRSTCSRSAGFPAGTHFTCCSSYR